MNENPEGMPNPLNPNSAAPSPAASMPEAGVPSPEPVVPVEVSAAPEPAPVEVSVAPETMPAEPAPESTPVEPASQPVTGNVVAEPKKSHKKAVIISVIVVLLVAIGCGAAAIAILKPFSKDPVSAAISKLMNSTPDYATMSGEIKSVPNTEGAGFSGAEIKFSAERDDKMKRIHADVTISAELAGGQDFTLSLGGIHTEDGNLYLRIGGVATILEQLNTMGASSSNTTNCINDGNMVDNCGSSEVIPSSVAPVLGFLSAIDEEWVEIPDSTFSSLADSATLDAGATCLVKAAEKLDDYKKDFADIYNANQFITSSTDNIAIAKKQDTLYRLGFDAEKMAGYINAVSNSSFMSELLACTGQTAANISAKTEDLTEILAEAPTVYVEIDEDDNITRLYMAINDENTSTTADISFSYPSSITIEKPEDYIYLTSLLSQMMGGFSDTDLDDQEWLDCQPPLSDAEMAACAEAEATGYPYIAY